MRIRTLIVDDEPPARTRLRTLLAAEDDIEIVGECSDGPEALEVIARRAPQLVFLDVQMPEMDGFELLRALDPSQLPVIIFVTAYDGYALRAFEVHALDYLLKPFDRERLRVALARARAQLTHDGLTALDSRLLALLGELKAERRSVERFAVKSGPRVLLVRVADIDWIEAAGNYVRLHVRAESHLLRESMKNIEAKLPPNMFLRIHRSAIVNIDRIRELQPWFHGEYVVILRDGTRLIASRAFCGRLHELLS